jgi:hypothetical protein
MTEGKTPYLTDKETTDLLYGLLRADRLDEAVERLKAAGDPPSVLKRWIGAQCDIHNIMGDARLSEVLARPGVEFALDHGLKREAAVLLHNIFAFYTQAWDEGVDPAVAPRIVDASRLQVSLRRELPDRGSYGWALWDLGMSELVAANLEASFAAFEDAERVHRELGDEDSAAWARLFHGKGLLRQGREADGREMMTSAANVIRAQGQDWEKEEVEKILSAAQTS